MTTTRVPARPALSLNFRPPALPPVDRGRTMNAAEVAREVCGGRVSRKWVLAHMSHLSWKEGREKLWYEAEARTWHDEFVELQRKRG